MEELFCRDYMKFLTAFDGTIATHLNEHINKFIKETFAIMKNDNGIKGNPYFTIVKDFAHYKSY